MTRQWAAGPRRMAAGVAIALLGLAAPAPVGAQGSGGAGGPGALPGGPGASRPAEETRPAAPSPFAQTRLLGDLGGLRTRLLDRGVDLRLGYIGEFGGNVTGERTGAGYAGQIAFSADIDWGKLADVTGFSTHFAIVNRQGNNLSRFAMRDNYMQSAEIYGAGFNMGLHLVAFYARQKLLDDRIDVAVGRMPVALDFAASPFGCFPIGLQGCGNPRALSNNAQFTSWPQSTWGGRVRVTSSAETYVQLGAYESKPFPGGGRTGWSWDTGTATGVIVPVEFAWEPAFGAEKLPGHYKVGFAYDSSDFDSLYRNASGGPLLLAGQTPAVTSGRRQFWVVADQMLLRHGPGPDTGLTLVGHYGNSTGGNSITWRTAWGGLYDKGFWRSRPNDAVMLTVGWWGVSHQLGDLQLQQQALGLPLANGAAHPQHNEYAIELDYIMPVHPGVTIEPAVQYFIHPNADARLKNAFVFAGRLTIDF
ncbi:Porin [Rhodovastum atsumiense]|nr:carbohydrate porin [Rhodovastum atsumiense]CAH2603581.1 Porin [Rhodovastum atsumiense]